MAYRDGAAKIARVDETGDFVKISDRVLGQALNIRSRLQRKSQRQAAVFESTSQPTADTHRGYSRRITDSQTYHGMLADFQPVDDTAIMSRSRYTSLQCAFA